MQNIRAPAWDMIGNIGAAFTSRASLLMYNLKNKLSTYLGDVLQREFQIKSTNTAVHSPREQFLFTHFRTHPEVAP